MKPHMKIGIGYDAHRLSENRRLVLGGVVVPHSRGLLGHSDADVLVHAIADALLGALGQGDIGRHFPDTDPAFKNISSLKLLGQVRELMRAQGYGCCNVDAVIVAEEPRLAAHIDSMRAAVAGCLAMEPSRVNIKATTTEGMGFEGRREGISAQAVVLLDKDCAKTGVHTERR
jgi:2-C-methyl-D-erythritol 2,4-cyclodiphosphate synthase